MAPVDNRGKVILLVDNTLTNSLVSDLDQLKQDLVGDGWTVIRYDVPRHIDDYSSPTSFWTNAWNITNVIKPLIVSNYNANPGDTKAVFILGHVSIPYSGFAAPDVHNNHKGAWPTDCYYGDIDGIWTDVSTFTTLPDYPEVSNIAGDGKFDQDTVPSDGAGLTKVELAVGRVDFAKLTVFTNPPTGVTPKSEPDLIRQYLAKAHRFRNGTLTFAQRVTATANKDAPNWTVPFPNAIRVGTGCFGADPSKLVQGDIFTSKASTMWGMYANWGSPDQVQPYTSEYLTYSTNEPTVGFYLLSGSYFGDWNLAVNNFLRSTLATTNCGLAAIWDPLGAAQWHFETLGMSETLGDGWLRSINVQNLGLRWMALMGDPTLRLNCLVPPSNLIASTNGGNVTLTWIATPQPDTLYHVYRSTNGLSGPFVRLTSNPIISAAFSDSSAPAGQKMYQVRALVPTTTGSGSYTNVGLGTYVTVN